MMQPPWSARNGRRPWRDPVVDGHFGNPLAMHMVRGVGFQLRSKLRQDAARSFP
jgi:hypothetical protein